ncbi:chemotaxis protein CheB [Brasilonema sp. UFV-L1]|uniref:chemotaxis protein CheB n=1 Tax=Brasilonema sp. UFV-L1 TaxID=2234130 RepID=UPI00145CC965|nr:chemotaxis protein CheB [Brasilonema sp. UFV-L1]NMG08163.1 chemotaxis protein CheB [Brasilonema sp. UFV-L1]
MTIQLIAVGASLGGLHALEVLLAGLPRNFPVPVAIVQHRYKASDQKLRAALQQYCALVVTEPQDKEEIVPGYIYLAPADYHLMVEVKNDTASCPSFSLSVDAPVTYARPSIDVLFETAADTYAEKLIGVLLTGANHDGTHGMAKIKARGGKTVVQEPSTAACSTMPKAAIAAGVADKVLLLADIAPYLVKICHLF